MWRQHRDKMTKHCALALKEKEIICCFDDVKAPGLDGGARVPKIWVCQFSCISCHALLFHRLPLCALLLRRRSLHCIEIFCRNKLPLNEQIWSKKHYTKIPWSHLHCYRSSSQGEMPCALVINESRDSPSYYSWMEPQREFQAQKLLLQQAMAQQLPSTLRFERNSFR